MSCSIGVSLGRFSLAYLLLGTKHESMVYLLIRGIVRLDSVVNHQVTDTKGVQDEA